MQETQTNVLQVRTPKPLSDSLRAAADRDMTSVSEFARRVLIDELRERGLLDGRPPRAQVGV